MTLVPLGAASDRRRFGGKAAQLAVALQNGLPVPGGYAVEVDAVAAVAAGHASLAAELPAESRFAVRSSAVDEDSERASFAGQHKSLMGVAPGGIDEAVQAVWASGRSEAAMAYRRRRGLDEAPRIAVVIQQMVRAEVAGVLFTRHPVTGADERVIEASWGLGETVVDGRVSPDAFRIDRQGRILERLAGHKDVQVRYAEAGGTVELAVGDDEAAALCLSDPQLDALHRLALDVEAVFEGVHDLEWAFDLGGLHLLQRRSITA